MLVEHRRRELRRLDEASFFEFLQEYLEALEIDRRKFEIEERDAFNRILVDKNEFNSREYEHVGKIKDLEGLVFDLSRNIATAQKKVEQTISADAEVHHKLKVLEGACSLEEIDYQAQVAEKLQEIETFEKKKENFQIQTSILEADLEILKKNNADLKEHIFQFQSDVAEIFYG